MIVKFYISSIMTQRNFVKVTWFIVDFSKNNFNEHVLILADGKIMKCDLGIFKVNSFVVRQADIFSSSVFRILIVDAMSSPL